MSKIPAPGTTGETKAVIKSIVGTGIGLATLLLMLAGLIIQQNANVNARIDDVNANVNAPHRRRQRPHRRPAGRYPRAARADNRRHQAPRPCRLTPPDPSQVAGGAGGGLRARIGI